MRRYISFWLVASGFLLAAAIALLIGHRVGELFTVDTVEATVEAESSRKSTEQAQPEALSGVFTVVWAHPKPGSEEAETEPAYVLNDKGEQTELLIEEDLVKQVGGPLAFNGKRVKVKGSRVPDEPEHLEVQAIQFEASADAAEAKSETASGEPAAEPLVSSSKPWVTIGCRFADSTDVTPRGQTWFENQQSNTEPGMDHFWRQNSYDAINLAGSQVKAWYNLPQPRSFYLSDPQTHFSGHTLQWQKIAQDCTAAADADVTFTNFGGINLMFNQNLDCCAWGGSAQLNRDGQKKVYSMTWMPPWGYNNHSILAQEMGHGFGLPHSSGPYSQTYDSKWDPMSSGGTCSTKHSEYGCLGDHTIAFHKDMMGWVPSSRKYTATTAADQNITLERVGQPASSSSYLMAKIPIPGLTTQFYTVEARRSAGYDYSGRIPGEAVVIHKVDTTLGDRLAKVVDSDNNGNPNDSGAMWVPGETFTDSANNISVKVTGSTASGYNVTINPSTTTPKVTSVSPTEGAPEVSRTTNVSATFSEVMKADTLTSTTFKLQQYNRKTRRWKTIPAAVSCASPCDTATLDPKGASETAETGEIPLAANKKFRGFITTGAKDLAGNPLASKFIWTFKTGG